MLMSFSKSGIFKKDDNQDVYQKNSDGKKSTVTLLLFGIILLSLCPLSQQYKFVSYLSIVAFVILLVCVAMVRTHFIFKYLPIVFAACSNLIGCYSCEFVPQYLGELRTYAEYAGSLPLATFSWYLVIVACFGWDSKFGVDDKIRAQVDQYRPKKSALFHLLNWFFLLLVVAMFFRVAPNPSFLIGLDRFDYAAAYMNGIWGTFSSIASYLVIIPLIAMRTDQKKIGIVAIALYLLFLFWTGTKFGGFFSVFTGLVLVYYDKLLLIEGGRLRAMLIPIAVVFAALLLIANFAMSFVNDNEDYLAQRTAQQGQLWWRVYSLYEPGSGLGQIEDEVAEQFNYKPSIADNVRSQYGIYKIMYLSAPTEVVDAKIAAGARYTSASFASAYYYGGVIGLAAFAVFQGLLTAITTNLLLKALSRRAPIESVLVYRISMVVTTATSMFIFGDFFDVTSIVTYIALFVIYVLKPRFGKTKQSFPSDGMNRLSSHTYPVSR